MSANRGHDTALELALRRKLWHAGLRGYRTTVRVEGIRPDVVFTRHRVAIFVHGCFWHRCAECSLPLPRANRPFWVAKFRRNRSRDRQKRKALETKGWLVIEFWGHELARVGGAELAASAVARSLRRRMDHAQQ